MGFKAAASTSAVDSQRTPCLSSVLSKQNHALHPRKSPVSHTQPHPSLYIVASPPLGPNRPQPRTARSLLSLTPWHGLRSRSFLADALSLEELIPMVISLLLRQLDEHRVLALLHRALPHMTQEHVREGGGGDKRGGGSLSGMKLIVSWHAYVHTLWHAYVHTLWHAYAHTLCVYTPFVCTLPQREKSRQPTCMRVLPSSSLR